MAKKKKSSAGKILLTILCILLALVLVVLIAGTFYAKYLLSHIQRVEETVPTLSSEEIQKIEAETDPVDEDFTGPELDPTDVTWSTEPVEVIEPEPDVINILLIGQDRRPGQGRQRSDSMILCTLNKDTKTLTMTSFLRDLYVQIPGHNDNRLNASYAFGGMPLLNECLQKNFGVVVDGNVEVDFSGFQKIVDILGGVSISLTSEEAGHLNRGNGWSLKKGTNLLTGEQALAYARIRKLDNDFGRTNRQRKVLTALIESCRNISFSKANEFLTSILRLITTDLTDAEIAGYVMELFPLLKDLKIETQHIPAEGTFQSVRIRGMAVLVPDLQANRQVLLETISQGE